MRNLITASLLLTTVVGTAAVLAACDGGPLADGEPTATPLPPVEAADEVVADAQVVPLRHATLSFPMAGTVSRLPVEEGAAVETGAVIARLDGAKQAAAVLQAEADLRAARAQLAALETGADPEDVAAARAALEGARAGVRSAEGAVASARANLARTQQPATEEDVLIAGRRVDQAENALWGAQAQRDSICGRVEDGFAEQSDCDGAEAEIGRAFEELQIARLQLTEVLSGARSEDVAASSASVQQAQGQLEAARAEVERAEANLAQVRGGPSDEDLDAATAAVDQAVARLETARLQMDDTLLRAPFAGTVASVEVRVGEQVTPGAPVARLADTSEWRVETDDLTELAVVEVSEGDPVRITFDALPELELPGRVTRIKSVGENRQGDIVYTVQITPEETDPRLRWNMTATVFIDTERSP